jgi:DNA-binding transcriptional regulator YiaG
MEHDAPHDLTTLPGWVKELRARMRMSQHDFAHRLGIARATLTRWEAGHAYPLRAFRLVLSLYGRDHRMPPLPPPQEKDEET